MPWVREDKCVGCGNCVKACPIPGAITMNGGKARISNALCTRCGKCFDVCPTHAIRPNSENPALRGMNVGRPGRGMGRGLGRGMGRGMGQGFGRGMGRGRW